MNEKRAPFTPPWTHEEAARMADAFAANVHLFGALDKKSARTSRGFASDLINQARLLHNWAVEQLKIADPT